MEACHTFGDHATCHSCQPTSSWDNSFFRIFMDKPAGAINLLCSIGVLCTIATHLTPKLSEVIALCTFAINLTQKQPQIPFSQADTSHFHQNSVFCHQQHHTPAFYLVFQVIPFTWIQMLLLKQNLLLLHQEAIL